MTIVFGVMTCCGLRCMKRQNMMKQSFVVGDGAILCFEEEGDLVKDDFTGVKMPQNREGAYICSSEYDEDNNPVRVSDAEDYVFYLNNHIIFNSMRESIELSTIMCMLGLMATIASLIGTIIYWNHNRA